MVRESAAARAAREAEEAAAVSANQEGATEVVIDPVGIALFGDLDAVDALKAASVMPRVDVNMARKINLGNYENLDFSFTVAVPIGMDPETTALFNELALEALQTGINIVKPEINERSVKILRQIGRLPQEPAAQAHPAEADGQ
jgi:hypothetical protein